MRISTIAILVAGLTFTIFEQVLLFAVARHLSSPAPVAAVGSPPGDTAAIGTSVRGAEVAERRACLVLRPLDLYDPRTSCEVR